MSSMSSITLIHSEIYVPDFNENTDEYIDKCPYKPYERNCIRYECRCKAGSYFLNNVSYKQHTKSQRLYFFPFHGYDTFDHKYLLFIFLIPIIYT